MHFDASGIIHAWDNYPITNFPPFWDWIKSEIQKNYFAICEVAFDEVKNKSPECAEWLKNNAIRKIPLSETTLLRATEFKALLGIIAENYHADGVGENDLLIISTAQIENALLLTRRAPPKHTPESETQIQDSGSLRFGRSCCDVQKRPRTHRRIGCHLSIDAILL